MLIRQRRRKCSILISVVSHGRLEREREVKEERDLTKKKKEERNPTDVKVLGGRSGGSKKTREKILIAFRSSQT